MAELEYYNRSGIEIYVFGHTWKRACSFPTVRDTRMATFKTYHLSRPSLVASSSAGGNMVGRICVWRFSGTSSNVLYQSPVFLFMICTGKLIQELTTNQYILRSATRTEIFIHQKMFSVLPAGLSKNKHEKKTPLSEKKNIISAKKEHFLTLYLFLKGYFVYLFYTKYPLSTCLKLLTTSSLIFQKPPILQNSKHL